MDRVLVMNYKTGLGRSMRMTLEAPREDITPEDIETVMDLILSKDFFNVEGGLAEIAGATIVTTQSEQVVFG